MLSALIPDTLRLWKKTTLIAIIMIKVLIYSSHLYADQQNPLLTSDDSEYELPATPEEVHTNWFPDGAEICQFIGVQKPYRNLSQNETVGATILYLPMSAGTGLSSVLDSEVFLRILGNQAGLHELKEHILQGLSELGNTVFTLSEPFRETVTFRFFLPTGIYPVDLPAPAVAVTISALIDERIRQFYIFTTAASLAQIGYQLSYEGQTEKARDLIWPGLLITSVLVVSYGDYSYSTRCLVKTTAALFGAAASASVLKTRSSVTDVIVESVKGVANIALVSASSPVTMTIAAGNRALVGTLYGDCQGAVNKLMPFVYLVVPVSALHYSGRNIPLLGIQPTTALKGVILLTDATDAAQKGHWEHTVIPLIFFANVLNRRIGYNALSTCLLLAVPIAHYLFYGAGSPSGKPQN